MRFMRKAVLETEAGKREALASTCLIHSLPAACVIQSHKMHNSFLIIIIPKVYDSWLYRIAGNFSLEKIFTFFASCSHGQKFSRELFILYCLHHRLYSYLRIRKQLFNLWLQGSYGDLYCMGENLFLEIFLKCKWSWVGRNFYPAKNFRLYGMWQWMHSYLHNVSRGRLQSSH